MAWLGLPRHSLHCNVQEDWICVNKSVRRQVAHYKSESLAQKRSDPINEIEALMSSDGELSHFTY